MADWDWQALGADTPDKAAVISRLVMTRHVPFDDPDKEQINITAIRIASRKTAQFLDNQSPFFARAAILAKELRAEAERHRQIEAIQKEQGVARLPGKEGRAARLRIYRSVPLVERTITVDPYRDVYRFFERIREKTEGRLMARLYRSRSKSSTQKGSLTHG